jgi:hypothetical protein
MDGLMTSGQKEEEKDDDGKKKRGRMKYEEKWEMNDAR